MFISKEEIKSATGKDIDSQTLAIAQTIIEAFVGKSESEVEDAGDAGILGRAVLFQAVYLGDDAALILEQAAVKSIVANESTTEFDLNMWAPYLSPFAVMSCQKLSWYGTRSVYTGKMIQRGRGSWVDRWVRD